MIINQKVKVKSLEQLRKITNIGFRKSVLLKSGLVFTPNMLCYADQKGVITDIIEPREDNQLTEPSFKIGEVDIYWSRELLEEMR